MKFFLLILFATTSLLMSAELNSPGEVTFSALRYERDLKNQISRGIGKAWVKKGDFLLEADELEIDYKTNEVTALGNVHYTQGKMHVFAEKGNYSLSGEKATMHNATVINERMVFTGKVIRRLNRDYFELEEGLYTNCNTTPVLDRSVKQCYFDWKIYARRFDILMDGYLNAYDAILYAKDLPVTYLPYYRAPAKSKRQSGFLYPQFIAVDTFKGSGVSIPYFQVLGDWHDFTLSPDIFSKIGYHIGTNYRYAYSSGKGGETNFYFTQKKFPSITDNPDNRAKPYEMTSRDRTLGFIGDWAWTASNAYSLGGETHSNQNIALVSDPYYPIMFESDLGDQGQMGYLKSQISLTIPEDNWLYTGFVRYDQSLIMTREKGTDNGPVGQLPSLGVFKKATTFLNYLSYDFDARLNNYYRLNRSIDKVPNPTIGRDIYEDLDGNDYIREGRRLQLEPRVVLNLPLPRGFEILPELKAGTLLYNFDYGESHFVNREYIDFQVPMSLYLSKRFATDISGLEEVRHVFQPRLTYAKSLYRSQEPTHQFFYNGRGIKDSASLTPIERSRIGLSSPRFDVLDQVQTYHYGRVDFIHNLYRRIANGYEQFLEFTLGQIYNIQPVQSAEFSNTVSIYEDPIGPIQTRLTVTINKFLFQTQGDYRIQKAQVVDPRNPASTDTKHNYAVTSTLAYTGDSGVVGFNFLYRHNAILEQENSAFNFNVTKTLPTFFDISTGTDYFINKGLFSKYYITFNFAAKPYSCWKLDLTYGFEKPSLDTDTRTTVALKFGLSFGGNVVFGL